MNKKLTQIIIIQTLLIVVLIWVLIFYGKDEYEAYQAELDKDIPNPSHVAIKQGASIVTLTPEIQNNSGIIATKIETTVFKGIQKSTGNVIPMDSLIDAKSKYMGLLSDLNIVNAAYSQNSKQYQRLKSLNDDDKNVSDRALQDAFSTVNSDEAKRHAIEIQLRNLQITTQMQWGEALAKMAFSDNLPGHLQNLLNRKNVLVQVSLPANSLTPKLGTIINVTPLNSSENSIRATYISPASQVDANSFGKTFYFSAPSENLRIGMRVIVNTQAEAKASEGVVIPSSAVIWYAGKPWVYLKLKNNQFIRKPISTENEIKEGWFNQGMKADNEVVISGAQLLLSEEFKYQIKNENED
jgi:hypothetical protein